MTGAVTLDHLLTARPIWFQKFLRISWRSKIRREVIHVSQDLKMAKVFFFPDYGSQALGIDAGSFPGTLEAPGNQFWATFS